MSETNRKEARVESLGRPAHFYLPASKFDCPAYSQRGKSIKTLVDEFLTANYGGYTIKGPYKGKWVPTPEETYEDEVIEITSAFKGEERIPKLQRFIAGVAKLMKEKCIYLECGEDSWLVYAKE